MKKKYVIVVVGPTAVGKTATSITLAQHFGAEIISADSRQIFREMTIGTAKPSVEEQQQVRHHFVDSHGIDESYDAAQFGEDALARIGSLHQHSDTVVVCGGSGLYIKALLEGFDDIPDIDPAIRISLQAGVAEKGMHWLQDQLKLHDPTLAATIDLQNQHRVMRALEVVLGTGQSIRSFQGKSKRDLPFEVIKIGLQLPRVILYDRIDRRMDAMIEQGLFEEAEALYPYKEHQALQTVGYQEIFDFMDGLYDREEAIRLLKRNSRRYAKRQLTWFTRDAETQWFEPHPIAPIIEWVSSEINRLACSKV
jgi:tRNA dimethylallyltransferase